jgi:hypothetical protein
VRRRAFLGAALATVAWGARAAVPPASRTAGFDLLWRTIDRDYAYFDDASRARWRRARERGRAQVARAASPGAVAAALAATLAELRDDHVTLSGAAAPARRIPYDLDIWPRWDGAGARIEAVRTFGDADAAGLHPGQVITRVEGASIAAALRERLGPGARSVADIEWALRRVIVGPKAGVQRLEVRESGRSAAVELERTPPTPPSTPPVLARRMGEERDIGYIRLRVGASDPGLAAGFAGAVGQMAGTRALIVDIRDTAGPGSREVTEAALARLAHVNAPLAALVNRWTAGEGEALAAGISSLPGARVVGTAMAGLRGDLHQVELPGGWVVRYPGERAFTPSGTPREAFRPDVAVDLSAPSGGPGDPILYQALKLFERR